MMIQVEGKTIGLRLNIGHKQPMKTVDSATFVAGHGIDGDRHFSAKPHRQGYQVLLIEEETLESFGLEQGLVRENVTTEGIDLSSMNSGDLLGLGDDVILQISKACAPCGRMDDIRPGLQEELQGRRGMLASVVEGGIVSTGDSVRILQGQLIG